MGEVFGDKLMDLDGIPRCPRVAVLPGVIKKAWLKKHFQVSPFVRSGGVFVAKKPPSSKSTWVGVFCNKGWHLALIAGIVTSPSWPVADDLDWMVFQLGIDPCYSGVGGWSRNR